MKSPWAIPNDPRIDEGVRDRLYEMEGRLLLGETEDERRSEIIEEEE